MPKSILLTSFSIWRAQQRSNASDDLLLEVLKTHAAIPLHVLRQLPVNLPVAREMAIAQFNKLFPHVLICCGMAESRTKLSVESRAVVGNQILQTGLNLEQLTAGLANTEISHDAGRFVCNSLYYAMLNYLQEQHPNRQCLFVHVPVLTPQNRECIATEFGLMIERVIAT